jgi:hypothetical protein
MAVTRTLAASSEPFFQQIDNVIKSHSLRGSESLCKLLQYLAKQALDHPDSPVKEYQIATEVFGRPADFDPQSDSTSWRSTTPGRERRIPSWSRFRREAIT